SSCNTACNDAVGSIGFSLWGFLTKPQAEACATKFRPTFYLNSAQLEVFHMALAKATETDAVSLVNISTEKWPPRHRTYFRALEVRSPENGEAFAITPIRGCTGVMDLGDKRTMEYRITAREIAEDIAREINNDSGEGSFHGVFVAAGKSPTEAELTDARRRL